MSDGLAALALALAIGFASLAVRPGREISMLQEWQLIWNHWRLPPSHGRLKSRRQEDLDFLRQINGDNDD